MSNYLDDLNEMQKKAVTSDSKYQLIIAGAGSGKTTVLTSKIIYLIDKKKVSPYNILAVTFTNKAASEMKERVIGFLGEHTAVMVKTFHSFGTYLLRQHFELTGRSKNFQIYDTDDSTKTVRNVLLELEIDKSKSKYYYSLIQEYKQNLEDNNLIEPLELDVFKEIYRRYNEALSNYNAFDFEDLILRPIQILKNNPNIRSDIQSRFKNILVDEYQDSNYTQFVLIKILSSGENSLTVVGDDDQSIYSFRGADVNNILEFEKEFHEAEVIKLELNYRCTPQILDLANRVIGYNTMRLGKSLYTINEDGNRPELFSSSDEEEEVKLIIEKIKQNIYPYGETAILYRTNNQSRIFEQIFNKNNIPYKVIGAIRFFEREEIKDVLAMLRWLINPSDMIAFERIISKPSRGIGEKGLLEIQETAKKNKCDLFKALKIKATKKQTPALKEFIECFNNLEHIDEMPISELLRHLITQSGLLKYHKTRDEKDGTDKTGNIQELVSSVSNRPGGYDNIVSYLEEVTLSGATDQLTENNCIKMLTIHNAKGLEFDVVFIAGMENGVFPNQTLVTTDEDLEEERRLFYVAITRARKHLYISYANNRNIYGRRLFQTPSILLEPFYDSEIVLQNTQINDNRTCQLGAMVIHKDYGRGKIIDITVNNNNRILKVDFFDYGEFSFIEQYANLKLIGEQDD